MRKRQAKKLLKQGKKKLVLIMSIEKTRKKEGREFGVIRPSEAIIMDKLVLKLSMRMLKWVLQN